MDLDHLRELLQLVADSDVAEVEIEEDDLKIVVRKQSTAAAPPPQPQTIAYAVPPSGYPAPVPAQGAAPAANSSGHQAPAHPAPAAPSSADSGADPAASNGAGASDGEEVRAPIVGTFYRSPSPEAEPFIDVGDHVSKGDVLCIIEAMKVMNEIEAEESGTIRKVLVEDATPVEYDQALFLVEPD